MNTPFGVTWDGLAIEHVVAFFAEPREEAQTWDAKGTTITPTHIRRSVCGFANSDRGGYTVLGVSQLDKAAGTWSVDGWEPPGEATQWVTDSLRGALDPLPPFAISEWKMDSGKTVAVVRVWPVAVPPCVTVDGYVYERVGTSTPQVRDSATLHRLVERGASAQRRAREASRAGRTDFEASPLGRAHQIVLAFAAPSLPSDIAHLAFRLSVADVAAEAINSLPQDVPFLKVVRTTVVDQHSLTVATESPLSARTGYTMRIRRMGSVTIGYADPDITSGLDWVQHATARFAGLWGAVGAALTAMGAAGPTHLAVGLADARVGRFESDWWTTVDVSNDTINAIVREIRRTSGTWAWEPE